MKNQAFGQLLKAGLASIAYCEHKTSPAIETDLGAQIGVEATTIQRYKAGHLPPELRTLEILAGAAVKRGLMSREWLQQFLRAANYPAPERLLDTLCPTALPQPRPPRIYENLPAPTYSQFVMREQAFAEVVEGLAKRSAAVLLVGLGGNGKTSLAREVAAYCLAGKADAPQFNAAVWVSDKDRSGTTNLSVVLDEIARTLDYPGFTQYEHEEKRREVEQLLRRQRVLVVIDNFETITDGALLSWLLNLPEPSKTLITTREYRREFRRGVWPVDLHGMTEGEARALIVERVRLLKIEKLVGELTHLDPLLAATGGNPKAIQIALGLIKYERRPMQQVVDDLYAARGELFDDLFRRAWALLDEAARRVLLVMTFFPASACGAAVGASADVQGFAFDCVVERLTTLALLDIQQEDFNSKVRYALHPLVRAFARVKLAEQSTFEEGARERWVKWYNRLVDDTSLRSLEELHKLDSEQDIIDTIIHWCFQNRRYSDVLTFAIKGAYYYYVRGYWDKHTTISLMGADAAHFLDKPIEEVEHLSHYIQVLSMQSDVDGIEDCFLHLCNMVQSIQLPGNVLCDSQIAITSYWMACGNSDDAEKALRNSLSIEGKLVGIDRVRIHKWLANYLYQKGRIAEVREIFQYSLNDALQQDYTRGVLAIQTKLAHIALALGLLEDAMNKLKDSNTMAIQYQDRSHIALIKYGYARLHILRGDLPAARAAFIEAIDLFERLGMRRELAEARAELAQLEATIACEAAPALA
jgi:hypothetical protein